MSLPLPPPSLPHETEVCKREREGARGRDSEKGKPEAVLTTTTTATTEPRLNTPPHPAATAAAAAAAGCRHLSRHVVVNAYPAAAGGRLSAPLRPSSPMASPRCERVSASDTKSPDNAPTPRHAAPPPSGSRQLEHLALSITGGCSTQPPPRPTVITKLGKVCECVTVM